MIIENGRQNWQKNRYSEKLQWSKKTPKKYKRPSAHKYWRHRQWTKHKFHHIEEDGKYVHLKEKMQSKTQQSACLGNICKECYNDKEPDKEEN